MIPVAKMSYTLCHFTLKVAKSYRQFYETNKNTILKIER